MKLRGAERTEQDQPGGRRAADIGVEIRKRCITRPTEHQEIPASTPRPENPATIQKIIFVSHGVKILNRPPRKNKNIIATTVELGLRFLIFSDFLS